MSRPFIIWTLQRTGGTALAQTLMGLSEHRAAEHEPFNWAQDKPREFWPIVEDWRASGDRGALLRQLRGVAAGGRLIKHCFELFNMSFNAALLEATANAGYRHVLLLRVDEGARLVSKFIAEAQGTWFADYGREVYAEVEQGRRHLDPIPVDLIKAQRRHASNSVAALRAAFAAHGVTPVEQTYEALYLGDAAMRASACRSLLEHLEFPGAERQAMIAAFLDQGKAGGQKTFEIMRRVPNIDAVVDGLKSVGCAPPAALDRAAQLERLSARLATVAEARGWSLQDNLQGPWPGLSLTFEANSSLQFRVESADQSFDNVYFGVKNAAPAHNKSLGEALFVALGQARYSQTWPWCRHPSPSDAILPVEANWSAGETLSRGEAEGWLAQRIVTAAETVRNALASSGYLAINDLEWAALNGLSDAAPNPAPPA